MKVQGKKAKAVFAYKPTMNDELGFKIDDTIVLTQCSEDETWYEGTLNGRTGWFPSNHVQILEDEEASPLTGGGGGGGGQLSPGYRCLDNSNARTEMDQNRETKSDEAIRIQLLNELKKTEEGFLDEMCKFVKVAIIPLQTSGGEIFPISFTQNLSTSLDDLVRCHQAFFQQFKEIPDEADAKIGYLLLSLGPQYKQAYDSYAKNHPKFVNLINKNKDAIAKFFEPTLSKMTSILLPTLTTPSATNYLTKFLLVPFKQLEIYVKLLKDIHRYTADYHIDRGDVQRALEFYSELSNGVQEMRKRKEYEVDIMSGKINKTDEDLFRYGESLFLSSVLVVDEQGEKKDRILMLFPSYLVLLEQNINTHEFDFDCKIPFVSNQLDDSTTPTTPGTPKAPAPVLLQMKRINSFDLTNSYGGIVINKYCFELSNIAPANSRLLFICSSLYDIKMWVEMLTNILGKLQFAYNNKSLAAIKAVHSIKHQTSLDSTPVVVSPSQQLGGHNSSSSSLHQSSSFRATTTTTSPAADAYTATPVTTNPSKSSSKIYSPSHHITSPQRSLTLRNPLQQIQQASNLITSPGPVVNHRKVFSMRPHPPLIPQFQLPNDGGNSSQQQPTGNDGPGGGQSATIKRFMYKKPKLYESTGKYHGADDDLRLLSVIESFCKLKPRQSVNVNVQEAVPSVISKANILPQPQRVNNNEQDDKSQIEAELQSYKEQVNKATRLFKEQKSAIVALQKQLEQERVVRFRLEQFIKKNFKSNNDVLVNVEHESSI